MNHKDQDFSRNTKNNLLDRFEKLVQTHLSKDGLTNAFLAAELEISERKLYQKIQELTGKTPNRYIRSIRLNAAKEMLESGRYKTVKEVVGAVGFRSGKYFTELFKVKFGITPITILVK